ncbi:MAG: CpsD/CapB family tyrosine-protein kinase [Bacilli bacterium]|nr:CpsD/CapB family tyrosine-protein kinase [Bacilli bacterium]MBN2696054.1 CpsD/CapB family tyrosine-protein kinase [Bacilli bacterium]
MEYFEYRNVVIETPNSMEAEAYRKMELNISMMSIDSPCQVIQCTSATPEDGKTTTAINLAAVYAEKSKRVIILDLDMRRPKIHRAFHKVNDVGFYDYITSNEDYHKLIVHDESNIDLLLTGKHISFPHIVLESHKTAELINNLRQEYDHIIVDSPPVLSVTDALIISKLVDGVVYVVAYNKTKKEDAKNGLSQLQKNNVRILGSVLANIDVRKSRGYYGYDYYSEKKKSN